MAAMEARMYESTTAGLHTVVVVDGECADMARVCCTGVLQLASRQDRLAPPGQRFQFPGQFMWHLFTGANERTSTCRLQHTLHPPSRLYLLGQRHRPR